MSAILFGSISTIADTSELQREAFNRAFEEHELDWHWPREQYLEQLGKSGGKRRIAEFARSRGEDVDAAAVHRSKSEIFQASLGDSDISPRPGVVETIREGKEQGVRLGLVTTTSQENVRALLKALSEDLAESDFDLVVDASMVNQAKPDPAAYLFALERMDQEADDCVAIEDNLGGVEAAQAAGLACAAFPNQNTASHDFSHADRVLERLSFAEVRVPFQEG
ncbi:MAG: HAD-IA family hydrolase [Solirubrobacterales bacterium]